MLNRLGVLLLFFPYVVASPPHHIYKGMPHNYNH